MKTFRKFLTTVDLADSYVKVESSYEEATLKLADCDDTVFIRFSWSKPKHTKASLKKLAVLESAIKMVREALESKL